MPTITIIIPVLNNEKYVRVCLDSIFSQTYKDFEVIVFDNESSDNTLEIAKEYPIKLIKNYHNVGWARTNNLCITQAKSKYIFLLNIDTVLHQDCLKNLYEFAESKSDLACVSPEIVEYSAFLSGKPSRGYPLAFDISDGLIKAYDVNQEYTEVSFVPGTALFANFHTIKEQLYFREDFFMYHEDVELSLRILARTPFKLYFLKTAIVAHDSKQSFSKISTCKLALRNLFTCLIEYQDYKDFLLHYTSYAEKLFRMYVRFYHQYYPFAYPVLGAYYFVTSLFKLRRHNNVKPDRLYEINQKLSQWPRQFEFIF